MSDIKPPDGLPIFRSFLVNHDKVMLGREIATPAMITLAIEQTTGRLMVDLQEDGWFNEGFIALVITNGAMFFAADLLRKIKSTRFVIESVSASSYEGMSRGKDVKLNWKSKIYSSNVLVIDDICDHGNTLKAVCDRLDHDNCNIKTCCLVKKQVEDCVMPHVHYYPMKCPASMFLVGYGLDYKGFFRNLPGLWEMKERE